MNKRILLSAMAASLGVFASAQVVFSEDFDVDHSSQWQFNSSLGGADAALDHSGGEADFFFDYSTVGIPIAPNSSGTTRGLKMIANLGSGTFSAVTVNPLDFAVSGDYTMRWDMWMNSVGPFPAGGSGSTQLSGGGVGGVNDLNWFGGTFDSFATVATGDGGSSTDYRMYEASGAHIQGSTGAYAADPAGANGNAGLNASDPYYAGFQGSVPAAQLNLFGGQTGAPQVGAQAFAWRRWEINKTGDVYTWSIDGTLIGTWTKATTAGDNIFFMQSDINAGSSSDANAEALLFGLVDNVEVELTPVPEPGTMAVLAGLGALALRRRKKN
ncbi:MAG: PEP-CTERM sorting domain-containing protein [Armatimonadetes bacterium]|nr:PEP-CTERM sorting domain-containing protein [Armatimonadota bacterium]